MNEFGLFGAAPNIAAGEELAVAATKTYTAQLTAIAMLLGVQRDSAARYSFLLSIPSTVPDPPWIAIAVGEAGSACAFMDQTPLTIMEKPNSSI